MDGVRDFQGERIEAGDGDGDEVPRGGDEAADTRIQVGTDERRMHVRAYNHWVSLLGGRAYPSIEDLDPANIADFGPHSVLLDFTGGIDDPAIAFLGRALREECALDVSITQIAQVPSRSLLSRLTDHYLQIIANRSPIGFEAEFVATRGHTTMYRGILMPFSSDGAAIDFIYGVINWKELVDPATQARLDAEIAAAVESAPSSTPSAPVWADGPGAVAIAADAPAAVTTLQDRLALAQETAAVAAAVDTRSRAALYRALDRALDFAAAADCDPAGYQALLRTAGIAIQLRAPMTPVAKLVFGADHDRTRLTEYATVLSHARRVGVGEGGLADFLEAFQGGIKGVVTAERALRRPARPAVDHRAACDARPVLARLDPGVAAVAEGAYVVLLARGDASGAVEIVAAIGDAALTERAMRAAG